MELTDKQRDKAILFILEQLAIHLDGDEQNPHAIATEMGAGLASPEIVSLARGHLIKDNYIDLKYPFFDLPFGRYATVWNGSGGWDSIDTPDTVSKGDLIQLHVLGEHAARKVFLMISVTNGSIWYMNTSEVGGGGNNNSTVWKNIRQTTILWKGEAGINEDMRLVESTRRFRTLKVTVSGIIGQTVEIPAVDNPVLSLATVANTANEAYTVRINLTDMQNQRVLRMTKCRLVTFRPTGNPTFTDDTGFKITSIEGIY
ncbi:hypothetical protein [Enterococcus mundtii]|uniref:hypothetical protein n=1 Tax=Enterococcus mundtii TaxID=53346 RepID=UPI0010BF43C9|nr:hypothetical protein [Enterococcus mundtii]QCJ56151.1 hypothetical protein DDJ96_05820 [Enterococcus mundtii]